MKELYRIGIIDDDTSKITQMITMIRLCCDDEDGQPFKEKYANCELYPIELALEKETNDMVERIVEADVDAVIIDYKLSSQQSVSYSGVSLAKELNQRLWGFPIFVLTTYRDDLFDHELFDSYLVFDFARYIEDDKERIEFNSKLIEQIKKYRIEMANCKSEFIVLPLEKPCNIRRFRLSNPQTACTFPCFFPYGLKQGKDFYSPLTTLSSSRAELRFASLVEWA